MFRDAPILAHRDLTGLCESRFGDPDLARLWGVSTLILEGSWIKWPQNETDLAQGICAAFMTRLYPSRGASGDFD